MAAADSAAGGLVPRSEKALAVASPYRISIHQKTLGENWAGMNVGGKMLRDLGFITKVTAGSLLINGALSVLCGYPIGELLQLGMFFAAFGGYIAVVTWAVRVVVASSQSGIFLYQRRQTTKAAEALDAAWSNMPQPSLQPELPGHRQLPPTLEEEGALKDSIEKLPNLYVNHTRQVLQILTRASVTSRTFQGGMHYLSGIFLDPSSDEWEANRTLGIFLEVATENREIALITDLLLKTLQMPRVCALAKNGSNPSYIQRLVKELLERLVHILPREHAELNATVKLWRDRQLIPEGFTDPVS